MCVEMRQQIIIFYFFSLYTCSSSSSFTSCSLFNIFSRFLSPTPCTLMSYTRHIYFVILLPFVSHHASFIHHLCSIITHLPPPVLTTSKKLYVLYLRVCSTKGTHCLFGFPLLRKYVNIRWYSFDFLHHFFVCSTVRWVKTWEKKLWSTHITLNRSQIRQTVSNSQSKRKE